MDSVHTSTLRFIRQEGLGLASISSCICAHYRVQGLMYSVSNAMKELD